MITKTDNQTLTRKPDQVVEVLRSEIVRGVFSPGSRMRPQIELGKRFGVSGVTIQHALSQLTREGFVYAKPGRGTFVAEDPPHLCHYGIIFHSHPSDASAWQQFWVALSHEAVALQQSATRWTLSLFYGVFGSSRDGDYDRLVDLVQRHQLAGLIFTSTPFSLVNTPLLTEPGIPRVAIHSKADFPGVVPVTVDGPAMEQRLVEMLIAKGRRRVGLIRAADDLAWKSLSTELNSHGIEVRPEWTHTVPAGHPEGARSIAQLLMSPHYSNRPDALLILDDNLVPSATAGVAASGVRVPDEVDVIAHCNFPWPTHSAVPAVRFGCDTRAWLEACISVIDDQRTGKEVPPMIVLPYLWENEFVRASAHAAAHPSKGSV